MSNKALFEGLSEQQQAEYEQEAASRWDPELVRQSNQRWRDYSKAQQQQILQQVEQVYHDWAAVMRHGPKSPQAQQVAAAWHQSLRYFYEPTREVMLGLAGLYIQDPRFADKFRAIDPGLPEFMQQAIIRYCQQTELTE